MFGTLKGRFIIFAVVLVVMATATAIFAQKNVKKISDEIVDNLSNRNVAQNYTQTIYDSLFGSYRRLSAFLLDPTRVQLRAEIHTSIQSSISASESLASFIMPNVNSTSFVDVSNLTALLIELDSAFSEVLSSEPHSSLGLKENGFQKTDLEKRMSQSREWRRDAVLIRQNIEPRLAVVDNYLLNLKAFFEVESLRDIDLLSSAAKLQSNLMWFVSGTFVVFFAITLFFFERLVIAPVSVVSRAMKAVAFGESGASLPVLGANETKDLIDAFNEMRSQVRSRQFELEHQALHDGLTGLANRTLLRDRLAQAVTSAKQSQTECALLILDLDRFKEINESLGHHAGDTLVVEVGIRLESMLRDIDTVARLGGDEFAILLPQSNNALLETQLENITKELSAIKEINGSKVYVSGTVGIATFPDNGANAALLLKRADAALHFAQANQQAFYFYDEKSSEISPDRLTLSGDLRDAIATDSLYLVYQPQLEFSTGNVIGVEALIRWRHPKLGQISADQIISIAEQTGQINLLTRWVMNEAVQQCGQWQLAEFDISMSINLSVLNLQDDNFIAEVDACFSRFSLPRSCLTFEITESAMMINPVSAMKTLKQLESMGVKLVIDDFGTGFSSLTYLKLLPVEKLKLDKSFVLSLDKDSDDEVIVRSTIDLAHNLGLEVVAEGVESRASWDILKALDCDYAQGYYVSKPKTADELTQWLCDEKAIVALIA